jgi:hypothetical protein
LWRLSMNRLPERGPPSPLGYGSSEQALLDLGSKFKAAPPGKQNPVHPVHPVTTLRLRGDFEDENDDEDEDEEGANVRSP